MPAVPASVRRLVDEPITRVALEARLTRPWRTRRFHAFGPRSILHRPLWVYGPHQIAVGADVVILHGAWLAVEAAARGRPAPVLSIGDRVGIRPHCTLSASEEVVLEDDVVLSAFSTVIDSDHTHDGPSPNVLYNPPVTAPVRIGRGTWVGERCAILRGARIGANCVIGANSVVRGEIPDGSVAVGAPARVVGRTRPRG